MTQTNTTSSSSLKEIVFIDSGIDDYHILVNGVNVGVEVYILDSLKDGILQITKILQQHADLDALHIISHGNVGYLSLGNSVLSTDTLNQYQHALFSWQTGLKQNADILIYGCHVAKGLIGQQFIKQLAELTGTNIAASADAIGNAAHNADWGFTAKVGNSTSPIVFNQKVITQYQGTLATEIEDFNIKPTAFNGGATPGSFAQNGFTYAFTGAGSGGHFEWENNDGSGNSGGISLDSNSPLFSLLVPEVFTITRTDGSPFVFNSIDVSALVNILSFKGKLDGNTLATTLTINLLGFQNITLAGGATIVDTIEVSALTFDDLADVIDNFSYDLNTSPSISTTTYDAATGTLVVTGTNISRPMAVVMILMHPNSPSPVKAAKHTA